MRTHSRIGVVLLSMQALFLVAVPPRIEAVPLMRRDARLVLEGAPHTAHVLPVRVTPYATSGAAEKTGDDAAPASADGGAEGGAARLATGAVLIEWGFDRAKGAAEGDSDFEDGAPEPRDGEVRVYHVERFGTLDHRREDMAGENAPAVQVRGDGSGPIVVPSARDRGAGGAAAGGAAAGGAAAGSGAVESGAVLYVSVPSARAAPLRAAALDASILPGRPYQYQVTEFHVPRDQLPRRRLAAAAHGGPVSSIAAGHSAGVAVVFGDESGDAHLHAAAAPAGAPASGAKGTPPPRSTMRDLGLGYVDLKAGARGGGGADARESFLGLRPVARSRRVTVFATRDRTRPEHTAFRTRVATDVSGRGYDVHDTDHRGLGSNLAEKGKSPHDPSVKHGWEAHGGAPLVGARGTLLCGPLGVRVVMASSARVELTWRAPRADPTLVIDYEVFRDGEPISEDVMLDAAGEGAARGKRRGSGQPRFRFVDVEPVPGATHVYIIDAVFLGGVRAGSVPAKATVPGDSVEALAAAAAAARSAAAAARAPAQRGAAAPAVVLEDDIPDDPENVASQTAGRGPRAHHRGREHPRARGGATPNRHRKYAGSARRHRGYVRGRRTAPLPSPSTASKTKASAVAATGGASTSRSADGKGANGGGGGGVGSAAPSIAESSQSRRAAAIEAQRERRARARAAAYAEAHGGVLAGFNVPGFATAVACFTIAVISLLAAVRYQVLRTLLDPRRRARFLRRYVGIGSVKEM